MPNQTTVHAYKKNKEKRTTFDLVDEASAENVLEESLAIEEQ